LNFFVLNGLLIFAISYNLADCDGQKYIIVLRRYEKIERNKMKKNASILALFLMALVFTTGCAKSSKGAMEYHEKLAAIKTTALSAFIEMNRALGSNDKTKYTPAYDAAVKATNEAVEAVKKEGSFNGDDNYRQKLQALLEFFQSVVANEYQMVISIISKYPNVTQDDQDQLNGLSLSISQREAKLQEELRAAQKEFSEDYGVTIEEEQPLPQPQK